MNLALPSLLEGSIEINLEISLASKLPFRSSFKNHFFKEHNLAILIKCCRRIARLYVQETLKLWQQDLKGLFRPNFKWP